MNPGSQHPAEGDLPDVDAIHASRLLELGLSNPKRPVDRLIDRLAEADGAQWLVTALERALADASNDPVAFLIDGGATVEQLNDLKDDGKQRLKASKDRESKLTAMTAYFFSIAAALLHHGCVICSRSRDDLEPVLLDLADIAPEPWSHFLSRAAIAPVTQA